MKKMTAVVALMAVFSLAICFIILGSISVELMAALNINAGQFGSLIMALFLTCCVVQLIIGPLVDKFGYKPIAILGFVVTGASLFLLAFAASFGTVMLACILLGVGAMSLNTVGNTLIPVVLFEGRDPARASNLGNAFFGLGYVLTPLLLVFFLKSLQLSYTTSVSILGALVLVFLVFALATKFPPAATGYKFTMAFKVLGKTAVWVAALALFCYMSLEITMATWAKPLMNELLGGAEGGAAKAGLALSLFGVAMMVGRFLASAMKNLTAMGAKVITAVSLVSVAAIAVMILTKSPVLALAAIGLTGLVFAPIFPTIVGVTFAKFEPALYGSIFGIIFAVGLLGATFVPKFIGNMSAGVGRTVQGSLPIAAVMAGILFVISLFIGRVGRPQKSE